MPSQAQTAAAPVGSWIDRLAPAAARPYLRLARTDKPIGGWLLMWPCLWSSAMAAGAKGWHLPDLWHLALFLIGAHVMRGAESTRPSSVDLANQDRFVRIGCEAIGMIFSLDGFVRFFSTLTDFDLVLYGAGGSIVSDDPREKVIKLEVA